MGFRDAKCIFEILRGPVLNFCINDIERTVRTSTVRTSTEISTKWVQLVLVQCWGYITEKCDTERWNGAFCFELELPMQELIKILETVTLVGVSGRIRGIFYH
jgi:hypothetical protein